ncbi:glycoside hydrolase family 65 protein, partial [Patescibacteria group bacterium]|nr:glycoside hydrolase family 65 protein [Patescibacteria group bacterium]
INRLGEAYEYFVKAAKIDIGEDMKSSDDGLHAASLGGIWLAVINGFAGIKVSSNELAIDPKLPERWENLKFNIIWRGDRYNFEIDKNKIRVEYSSLKNKKSVSIL